MDDQHWTEKNETALKQIKKKVRESELHQTLASLSIENIDAFHRWRDAEFNLIFHSILENNKMAFKLLIEFDANPTASNNVGTTPLQLLMKRNYVEWAELILNNMKNDEARKQFVNQATYKGWSPLMSAAENGHVRASMFLLKHGADPNHKMDTGWTAMHAASKKKYVDVLRTLLEHKGDKNILASHRDFGRNLKVEDVTTDKNVLDLLNKF